MRIIVPTTHGMMDMAENAVATLRAFDREAEICVLKTGLESIDQSHIPFGTNEFRTVTLKKMKAVLGRLRNGETVLLVDADIVVRRDPIPYIEKIAADLIIQDDSPRLFQKPERTCTGFFLARPTQPVIDLFEKTTVRMEKGAANDQVAFNACIGDSPDVQLHRLDPLRFPNGRIWRSHRPSDAYIVHANWVRGRKEKLQILKRTGYYGGGSIGILSKFYRKFWKIVGDLEHLFNSYRNLG